MTLSDSSHAAWVPWMYRALELASLAEGRTSPNPLVGAIVLNSNGDLIGEGFHSRSGTPHAEVKALNQAGKAAEGGTLVVSLEPCCHQGLTPPCTEAVLAAGVAKVVIALKDPDPRVQGKGIDRLRGAGLEVLTGVLEDEAAFQNRVFIHRVSTGRPWGILKWAMSLDGRTSLPNGLSKWISCGEARQWVHSLRSYCDAVIVGGGTLRKDNPLLTSRGQREPEPFRVVMSQSLDLPQKANLWDTRFGKTFIAHGPLGIGEELPGMPEGPEFLALRQCEPIDLLKELAKKGCNTVLWECGPKLAAEAIKQGCVQELDIVVAPKLLGGLPTGNALDDLGLTSVEEALLIKNISINELGQDLLLKAFL